MILNTPIKIKPHHFIDIITSFSHDPLILKPHPFGHAVHTITEQILKDKNTLLQIELGADDICKPCIHNHGGFCMDKIDNSYRPEAPESKRAWNLILDNRWCEKLNLKNDDKISVMDFCLLLNREAIHILDIYSENPINLTRKRENDLKKGLKNYLESQVNYFVQTS